MSIYLMMRRTLYTHSIYIYCNILFSAACRYTQRERAAHILFYLLYRMLSLFAYMYSTLSRLYDLIIHCVSAAADVLSLCVLSLSTAERVLYDRESTI